MNNYERAAKLLLQGARMLRTPCPQCRDPIYQLPDTRLICATCESLVIKEDDRKIENTPETNEDPIRLKIKQLSKQLDEETDPDKILNLASIIKKLQSL